MDSGFFAQRTTCDSGTMFSLASHSAPTFPPHLHAQLHLGISGTGTSALETVAEHA